MYLCIAVGKCAFLSTVVFIAFLSPIRPCGVWGFFVYGDVVIRHGSDNVLCVCLSPLKRMLFRCVVLWCFRYGRI